MTNIGHLCLGASLIMSAVVTGVCVIATSRPAWLRAGRRLAFALPIPWLAMVGVLVWALCIRDDRVRYVAEHVDPLLPLAYRIAALWAGQEGSLLVWAVLLSLVCAGVSITLRGVTRRAASLSLAVIAGIVLSMGLILVCGADPFRASGDAAIAGPSQQLRHWAMLIHPPLIFAGYSLCAAPCAIAVGALASRRQAGRWVVALRPWALGAWLVLGTGIILGAWWAYTQLGWGGYWAWDPVENASLIPWLTVTALVHSVAVCRRRGVLATWTAALAMTAFVLCVFGTFVTRGGIVESIHSFGRSTIGWYLGGLLMVLGFGAGGLLISRRQRFTTGRHAAQVRGPEWLVLAGTLLLAFAATAVFVGTAIPMVATLVARTPGSVGKSFYETTIGPSALVAAALMAISPVFVGHQVDFGRVRRALVTPLVAGASGAIVAAVMGLHSVMTLVFIWVGIIAAWLTGAAFLAAVRERVAAGGVHGGRAAWIVLSSGRRLLGGRLAHVGLCVLLAGVCASSLLARTWDVTLRPGESRDLGSYRITLERVAPEQFEDAICVRADVTLIEPGGAAWSMSPRRRHYNSAEQPLAEVAIHSTPARDLYVALGSWDDAGDAATLHVRVIPGVMWIWIGAGMIATGGIASLWPTGRRTRGATKPAPVAGRVPGRAVETLAFGKVST